MAPEELAPRLALPITNLRRRLDHIAYQLRILRLDRAAEEIELVSRALGEVAHGAPPEPSVPVRPRAS